MSRQTDRRINRHSHEQRWPYRQMGDQWHSWTIRRIVRQTDEWKVWCLIRRIVSWPSSWTASERVKRNEWDMCSGRRIVRKTGPCVLFQNITEPYERYTCSYIMLIKTNDIILSVWSGLCIAQFPDTLSVYLMIVENKNYFSLFCLSALYRCSVCSWEETVWTESRLHLRGRAAEVISTAEVPQHGRGAYEVYLYYTHTHTRHTLA